MVVRRDVSSLEGTKFIKKYKCKNVVDCVSQELEDTMKDSINKDYKCKNVVDCFVLRNWKIR